MTKTIAFLGASAGVGLSALKHSRSRQSLRSTLPLPLKTRIHLPAKHHNKPQDD
jgi:hypothetical protein